MNVIHRRMPTHHSQSSPVTTIRPQMVRNDSKLIINGPPSFPFISNCTVRPQIVSNSSIKPLNRRHNSSQLLQKMEILLSLVSRCPKEAKESRKRYRKTPATVPQKVFLVTDHAIMPAQRKVVTA